MRHDEPHDLLIVPPGPLSRCPRLHMHDARPSYRSVLVHQELDDEGLVRARVAPNPVGPRATLHGWSQDTTKVLLSALEKSVFTPAVTL
jgi:hypothetical protein